MIEFIIKKITIETPQAKTFELSQLSGTQIDYKPGQFLTFVFPHSKGQLRRSYSISSSPYLNEPLRITVKRIDNGEISRYFFDKAKEGDKLYCSGTGGFFTLPDHIHDYKEVFLIGAGSGIVPIFSLIKTILYLYPDLHIHLIYSNKGPDDTIFKNELDLLTGLHSDRFHITYLFSSSHNLLRARLNNTLLTEIVKTHRKSDYQHILFYTCGPFEYMDTVIITLLTEGIPLQNIRKENFNSIKPVIKEQPPDQNKYNVYVDTGRQQICLEVQYPTSILQQARLKGINLPYSCESGQCGSCTARVIKGKVWMAYNEVLTNKELNQGLILTCQAFPVYGDVYLEFN